MMQNGRKSTQRERILRGMIDVANRGGYASANVSAVIGRAGVSRPTFYDYFADRDDCFLQSIADVQQQLLAAIREAVESGPPEEATAAAVEALVGFASAEPARARFLMSESMAGGPAALDARDQGIAEIAEVIEQTHSRVDAAVATPDVDHRVLIGGVYRVLSTRLRRGEPAISKLIDELLPWIKSYEQPAREHRWWTLAPAPPAPPSPHVPDVPIQQMPSVLPPGRPRLSEEEVAENHRLRILYAAARMAESKGYTATTVADITKFARVDGHVFYRLFSDKQDAFTSVHELGFQQVMDVASRAFFAGANWPERSWEAGRALTQLLEDNPLLAHVGFVEAYAVGPGAVQRIEDSHIAFMFFLQEGLVYRKQAHPPSRTAMEAIITCIFEIIYRQSRHGGKPEVASMLAHIAHVWLTPFLGPQDADELIDRQLEVGADAQSQVAKAPAGPRRRASDRT
jgi:AcrR family transcriptional regulator